MIISNLGTKIVYLDYHELTETLFDVIHKHPLEMLIPEKRNFKGTRNRTRESYVIRRNTKAFVPLYSFVVQNPADESTCLKIDELYQEITAEQNRSDEVLDQAVPFYYAIFLIHNFRELEDRGWWVNHSLSALPSAIKCELQRCFHEINKLSQRQSNEENNAVGLDSFLEEFENANSRLSELVGKFKEDLKLIDVDILIISYVICFAKIRMSSTVVRNLLLFLNYFTYAVNTLEIFFITASKELNAFLNEE